jgi:hypothetical protein
LDKEWLNSLQWKVPETADFYSVQLDSWEDRIVWDDSVVPTQDVTMDGYDSLTIHQLIYVIPCESLTG